MYILFLLKLMWKYEMILFLFTGLGGLIFCSSAKLTFD
jgi:hypothetical protein